MLQKESNSLPFMLSTEKERTFLSGPGAKILCSRCRGQGFDPWFGNQDTACRRIQNKLAKNKLENKQTTNKTEMGRDEKAGRMESISSSFLLFFSCWCSFLASIVLIPLLPFHLLFVVLYLFVFSVSVLSSPSSCERKSSLLGRGKG